MADAKLNDEAGRLAALQRYQVLDTGAEQPFEKITNLVQDVLEVPIAAVTLVDDQRQWFKSRKGICADETARDVSFCTHTIQDRAPMIVPDARDDPRFATNPLVTDAPNIRSYLGAPLETPDGYNIGALCAIDTQPRAFDESQAAILSNFAKLVVDELELRQIASSDSLTGVLTRRGWLEAAKAELERARRYDRPASVAMFDIDHFKRINDTHGHPAGDAVLKAVARTAGSVLRENDVLGRLGGEEFAVLLPETAEGRALDCAERIRAAIAAATIPTEAATIGVTASFGLCELRPDVADAEAWLARADDALYAAKRDGRNRVATPDHALTPGVADGRG